MAYEFGRNWVDLKDKGDYYEILIIRLASEMCSDYGNHWQYKSSQFTRFNCFYAVYVDKA